MSDAATEKKSETNVKDTIESILVAFILAFIFRCFVIEAFVIPTGSMAPTLMGAHMNFRCPHCGYGFDVGYQAPPGDFSVPTRLGGVFGVLCPNCGLSFPRELANDAENDAANPLVHYGDRILVMKYLYLFDAPKRWDVVVFKSPQTDVDGDYSTNFIKRLIGSPGESLFIAQGDLYVAPAGADRKDPGNYKIQTKPKWAQDALWRIVFDADYIPEQPKADAPLAQVDPPWVHPWQSKPGSGWLRNDPAKGVSARQFAFGNTTGTGKLEFNAAITPSKGALTDWLTYDYFPGFGGASYATEYNAHLVSDVSDLKLSAYIDSFDGAGAVRFVLGKGDTEFIAEVTQSSVKLLEAGQNAPLAQAPITLKPHTRISIQNVDYRVSVSVDGIEVLHTTPEQYSPKIHSIVKQLSDWQRNAKAQSPRGWARVEGEKSQFVLSHLQLWRDVYYRDQLNQQFGFDFVPRAVAYDFPNRVVTLGPDEYFAMGDNSFQSADGRVWNDQVNLADENLKADAGRVPGRFMLGKAFFVYWPSGYRPGESVPALIPNFGQMRFIR